MHSMTPDPANDTGSLEFLWLELTNKCNLECSHCYASSSPTSIDKTPLSQGQYFDLLQGATDNGCKAVQFIGGEPTLNTMLPSLIIESRRLGFEYIEVFTNLVALPDHLLKLFSEYNVCIATSVYSQDAKIHDSITTRDGSWARTVRNLKRILEANLPVRASIIEMELNSGESTETRSWLQSMGVTDIGIDFVRQFGRQDPNAEPNQANLCGECAHGKLCVSPDGNVSPCIMSKAWSVGSAHEQSVDSILKSDRLKSVRDSIYKNTIAGRQLSMGGCNPDRKNPCGPDQGGSCNPCNPNGHCGPNDCQPVRSMTELGASLSAPSVNRGAKSSRVT